MTIQFNGFIIDAQKISSTHQESIQRYLSSHFSNLDQKIPVHFKVEGGRSLIEMEGRTVVLPRSSELKRVERIFRFYQNAGIFPQPMIVPTDRSVALSATQKSVEAIHNAAVPGTNGSLLAGIRIADDSLALARTILSALPSVGARDPLVRHLGYYAGVIWTFFSFRELDQGIANYSRAKRIEDSEGLRRARASVVSGALCSVGSIAYLTGRVCESVSEAAGAAGAFGAASLLFGLGSILAAWASYLGACRCSQFNERLQEYLQHPRLTQVERFRGALNFLKGEISVTLTLEERTDLIEKISLEHPSRSSEEREALLVEKIADLTEVKVKYMKRRTSSKSLYLILTKTEEVLAKLNDPLREKEGLREAALLLMAIEQENNVKMSLYILGFIAALIGLAALAVATFLTAGVFPFVLYGISGTIYLATTLYQSAGVLIKRGEKPLIIASR